VVNKKTVIWFTVIKLVIYIFTASFFAFNALNAKAAFGVDPRITQVKVANSGTIYYLDHSTGQKKGYVNMSSFKSYGNKKSEVKTVSASTLKKFADARFIRVKDGSTVYFIKGRYKTAIYSKALLSDLGYSEDKVIVVNPADFLSYKTVSNAKIGLERVAAIANDNRSANAVPATSQTPKKIKAGVGGDDSLLLTNKLAVEIDDSLLSEYLVAGSSHNLVAQYHFRTAKEPVTVRGLLFNVNGVYSSSLVKRITVEIPNSGAAYEAVLNNRIAKANFGPDNVIIPANSNLTVEVYLDLNDFSATNNTINFILPQGENVLTDVSVGGRFPVASPTFKLADGGNLLGALTAEEQKLNNPDLIFGSSDSIVAKYKFSETTGAEDIIIKQITFFNAGGITPDAISALKLKDNYNNDLGNASLYTDNSIIFKNVNYKIKRSQVRTFTLYGSIGGAENLTSNFNISEIVANGQSYGYNVAANIVNDQTAYAIKRYNITVESADLITTKTANKRQEGTVIGNFKLKNSNQSVKLEEIALTFGQNSSAPSLKENLFLVNYETGELIDNKPATNPVFNLHNLNLKPYESIKVAVVTNLPDSAGNNDWYWLNLDTVSYRYANNLIYKDVINVKGNVFYPTKASIYVYPNDSQPAKELNIIRGQKQAKVASFILEAAESEDAVIKNISFKQGSETSNRMMAATGFTNIKLSMGSQITGRTIASPTADNYQFDNVNYTLRAGKRIEVKVYADVSKNASINDIQLAMNNINAINAKNKITAEISGTGINAKKISIGSLDGDIAIIAGGRYAPGIKDNLLGTFEVKNSGAEAVYLKNVTLTNRGQKFTYSAGFSNLRLVNAASSSRLGSISSPVSEVNKISMNGTKLESGSSMTIEIRIDAKNTAPSNNAEIFINQIEIKGVNSQISTTIKGDSAQSITVTANPSSNPTGLSLAWPTSSRRISYYFHDANYPFIGYGEHTGIDIVTSQGTSVYAAGDGEVIDVADNHNTNYNYVTIRHADGLTSTYGHLSRVDVKMGDRVQGGQKIGLSGGKPGTTGAGPYTNGAHLHFEVSLNGELVDPLNYLQ
jgi:murein DD-endopeptidase MepM/ murein hydrolase activator NlpD